MYDFLKELATNNNWFFEYGRADYNNLTDIDEQKEVIHLFLDPVQIGKKKNDAGVTEEVYYTGSFMMLYSSDIDELSYQDRYDKYIKPILENEIQKIEDYLTCEGEVSIDFWDIIEVINVFDYNLDGVIIKYKLTGDE